ncbi:hypothetical protein GWK47_015265 [Chionoecetes opilio]|uniref:Uncharacterized protein n=1 Tax=Chionoecetes opilio TaxID=41210 RepID=A0A8J4XSI9_CHIOP|nr:hypothetical protein GWK47_015265 [Chionoecetes opilio]
MTALSVRSPSSSSSPALVKDEGQRQYLLRVVKHHRSECDQRCVSVIRGPISVSIDEALKNRVRALKMVNDGAVKDEGQLQYLLRVDKPYRGEVPKRTKAACSASSL